MPTRTVPSRRVPRGYVLLFVLVLLMVVTLLAAAVMQTAYYDGFTMTSSRFQSEAALNSVAGAQEAIARLRSAVINPNSLPICPTVDSCPLPTHPMELGDPNRYTVRLVQRTARPTYNGLTFSNPQRVVLVSSLGRSFAGSGSLNPKFTSLTELELQVPEGSGGLGGGAGGGNEKPGG